MAKWAAEADPWMHSYAQYRPQSIYTAALSVCLFLCLGACVSVSLCVSVCVSLSLCVSMCYILAGAGTIGAIPGIALRSPPPPQRSTSQSQTTYRIVARPPRPPPMVTPPPGLSLSRTRLTACGSSRSPRSQGLVSLSLSLPLARSLARCLLARCSLARSLARSLTHSLTHSLRLVEALGVLQRHGHRQVPRVDCPLGQPPGPAQRVLQAVQGLHTEHSAGLLGQRQDSLSLVARSLSLSLSLSLIAL